MVSGRVFVQKVSRATDTFGRYGACWGEACCVGENWVSRVYERGHFDCKQFIDGKHDDAVIESWFLVTLIGLFFGQLQ